MSHSQDDECHDRDNYELEMCIWGISRYGITKQQWVTSPDKKTHSHHKNEYTFIKYYITKHELLGGKFI